MGEVFFGEVSVPLGLPAPSVPFLAMSPVVLAFAALPQQMTFPFCSRAVLGRKGGGEEGRMLEHCLLCYQTPALESWKGSTWERVPEKTNFRSRLIWEKACEHGGSFGDLGRG